MNGTAVLRKEMCDIIDTMPERKLYALRPLLDVLAEEDDDADTSLSPEEEELLAQCRKDRREHPETFITLEEFKRRMGAGEPV